ncbi:hypothetical protein JW979_06040, partial [bacterium]|nr:hypothetical protein [candidate division CSSED10-310 bacterium]
FYLAVKFPSMSKLVKRSASKGSYSELLRWIFNVTYAYRYSKTYRMPFWELMKRAILWKDNY